MRVGVCAGASRGLLVTGGLGGKGQKLRLLVQYLQVKEKRMWNVGSVAQDPNEDTFQGARIISSAQFI